LVSPLFPLLPLCPNILVYVFNFLAAPRPLNSSTYRSHTIAPFFGSFFFLAIYYLDLCYLPFLTFLGNRHVFVCEDHKNAFFFSPVAELHFSPLDRRPSRFLFSLISKTPPALPSLKVSPPRHPPYRHCLLSSTAFPLFFNGFPFVSR